MPKRFSLLDFSRVQKDADSLSGSDLLGCEVANMSAQERAALALAIYRSPSLPTVDLVARAEAAVRAVRGANKSTFVPIFTTNHCDSECLMCGMRKGNTALVRKFSGKKVIEEQLRILYEVDGLRGVGFLTGEYAGDYTRKANAFLIGWAIRRALDMGFESVYFNIGSLSDEEITVLAEWVEPSDTVTLCVFQETYDQGSYVRFMGQPDPEVPKSDFMKRICSFDNWLNAGFSYVNPGFLVGLHAPDEDLVQLVAHVGHLVERGANVRISLPRLRPALGSAARLRVSDADYVRLIATVAYVFPGQPIVLTTRETQEFQDAVMPLVGIISPGSPDVAPYRRNAEAVNELSSSQFVIPDHRRPREILTRISEMGYTIQHFAQP